MIYRIDIDDTIIKTDIDNNGYYHIKSIYSDIVRKINKLYDEGHTIIIETGRHWNHLKSTLKHLEECEVKYHSLIMGKPPADYILDDKSISPDEFLEL